MCILIDGRDKSFEIKGKKEILEYLNYPKNISIEEARIRIEKENDGMDFYHIV